ncbi:phosphonate C-P lyase system protein PhnG [Mesobacillus foraminis]|uniref:Alpha-D-ribose 1-methylphosphonate 5-triphosphate synthase subunit PhnG n=1 Tax=Mesobacillus foraminis TaxID=279826 RepID=A0A4R2B4Y6_9BACI|nr:phosphonate C-P lyase system protein PhnG [Mesobacillus foraminis]TCN21215.1 alpha-D-ribose 1-methylphosphonate 5-triphosphate synthase subunit PhnG [Mesobacillus foraminis]
MKRKRRTEILIKGSRILPEQMTHEVERGYQVKIIQEPENGLVMLKVRETSQKSLFYLGEVLVTECKVQIQNHIGLGVVSGDEPQLAYQLAVIDAAFEGEFPETKTWLDLLETEEQNILEIQKSMDSSILRTKVSFETMDVG